MEQKKEDPHLWVGCDRKTLAKYEREVNWLDIVSSATESVYSLKMIAEVVTW